MLPKLSIIVPVYNVEKYVAKCLQSIFCQNSVLENIEIIIVNDGSTDNSAHIVAEFIADKPNTTFIAQKNRGLSAARNVGLSRARGEYIWFIDSDDSICENALTSIWNLLDGKNDIISFDTNIENEEDKSIYHQLKGTLNEGGIDYTDWIKNGLVYPYTGAQFYVYKREYLSDINLKFCEGIYFEDVLFTPQAICKAKQIYHLKRPIYNYLVRRGSITQSTMSLKKWYDFFKVADEFNVLSKNASDFREKKFYNTIISIIGGRISKIKTEILNRSEKELIKKEYYLRKYWRKSMVNSFKKKYLLRYFIFKYNSLK